MTEHDPKQEQSERFERALERKDADARERAEASRLQSEEASLMASDRQPDQLSVRAKSTGHGKKTADKWNQ